MVLLLLNRGREINVSLEDDKLTLNVLNKDVQVGNQKQEPGKRSWRDVGIPVTQKNASIHSQNIKEETW